jgi:hypothetical protein
LAELAGPLRVTPLVPDETIVAAADEMCRESAPVQDAVELVVVDARGSGRLSLFYAGPRDAWAQCPYMTVNDDGSVDTMGGNGGGTRGGLSAPMKADEVRVVHLEWGGQGSSGHTLMVGRAGPSMRQVTVRPPEGGPILTTLTDGWWSAWWPGTARGRVVISGFDSSGTLVSSVRE